MVEQSDSWQRSKVDASRERSEEDDDEGTATVKWEDGRGCLRLGGC